MMSLGESLEQLEARFCEWEPNILAFLPEEGRFERLRKEAAELQERFPDPERRPPLFGLPVGVKDIFHVGGFTTRAGSRVPAEELQGAEAESVSLLKKAGALILGKTATTEFAYFAPALTRNPHNPAHTPGGSSSGSAAATAAGLCRLALGTQTIGSIIRPAAFCGAVGFKPSYERISREGVIPLSPSLDHVGFFTSDVHTARMAAGQLCRDWKPVENVLPKPMLAVPEGSYLSHVSAQGLEHFRAACRYLASCGYEIRSVPAMPDFHAIQARHSIILAHEAAQVHAAWYSKYASLYHPKTAGLIQRGQSVSRSEFANALGGRERLRAELAALMDEHGLDLWLSPSAPGPAPKGLESTGDPVMNLPWTHAGLPALNLPLGKDAEGLPLGLQVTGRWYGDEAILSWAGDLEAALVRHSPLLVKRDGR